jgi:hypothetical protein
MARWYPSKAEVVESLGVSTSEKIEFRLGVCPCGAGEVRKHIISHDNPWSGADVWYEIACPACKPEWRLSGDGMTATNVASEKPAHAAAQAEMAAQTSLNAYLVGLAKDRLAKMAFSSKKAEHAFATSEGLFKGSYQSFLTSRKARELYDLVNLHAETPFKKTLLDAASPETLRRLNQDVSEAQVRRSAADKTIKRVRIA